MITFYRYKTSHFLRCYSNLEMTSYSAKYGVYFEKDLIRTKLPEISKTTLTDSNESILFSEPKKTLIYIVSNLHSNFFNKYIEEKLY